MKDSEDIVKVVEYLMDNGINIGEKYNLDQYIGEGSYAKVYKIKGVKKVIKIHEKNQGYDFDKYIKLLKETKKKKFENVVNIYFNREITSVKTLDPIAVTVMDYLQPIKLPKLIILSIFLANLEDEYHRSRSNNKKDIEKYYNKLTSFIKNNELDDDIRLYNNEETIRLLKSLIQKFKSHHKELNVLLYCLYEYVALRTPIEPLDVHKLIEIIEDYDNFFKDIFNGIEEFKRIDERHDDIHLGNVLWDDKAQNYKLIDPI